MYKVYFDDKTLFEGGTLHNSKWNEMPDKAIVKLEYCLFNKILVLEGFEAYNHLIEFVKFVNKNDSKISKVILLGKTSTKSLKIEYDFIHKEMRKLETHLDQEYNGKSVTGWKKGLLTIPKWYIK